jgi:hypothetical protein
MRTAVAAIFAALLLAAPAQALDGDWRARAGIEKAKAAGIKIDPAAEELMARAPSGTCANDPTLPKCPPAHAVVFTGSTSYADDGTPVALSPSTTHRRPPVAHAAIDQCRVRVTDRSPYKAVGMAQMDAQNYCSAAVTTHELYGVLRKYYNGQWYAMASRYKGGGIPGKTLYVSVRYDCTATPVRAWVARADAYALLRGVWYAGTQSRYNNLACG